MRLGHRRRRLHHCGRVQWPSGPGHGGGGRGSAGWPSSGHGKATETGGLIFTQRSPQPWACAGLEPQLQGLVESAPQPVESRQPGLAACSPAWGLGAAQGAGGTTGEEGGPRVSGNLQGEFLEPLGQGQGGGPGRRARLQLVQWCLTPSQLETLRMMSPVEKRSSRPKRAFLEGFWGKGNGGPCQPGTLAVRAGLQAPHRPQFLMKSWAHALLELSSFISAQCLLVFQIQVRAP